MISSLQKKKFEIIDLKEKLESMNSKSNELSELVKSKDSSSKNKIKPSNAVRSVIRILKTRIEFQKMNLTKKQESLRLREIELQEQEDEIDKKVNS